MFSRPLVFFLFLGCLTAAAGGAYVATRHNSADSLAAATTPVAGPADKTAAVQPTTQPVAETEAPVSTAKVEPSAVAPVQAEKAPAARRQTAPEPQARPATPAARVEPGPQRTVPLATSASAGQTQPDQAAQAQVPPPLVSEPSKAADPQPEPVRAPQFEEVIIPAASVIGLQLETSLSSDRTRVEDRVDARVSRDVMAAGRVAIPAGARVIGSVIEVDKGGKLKTPAHIGIRFHTLVLADGSEVALRTEPIYRDGESPVGNSAKKIGGAAVAGTVLGALLGGGKGAAIGGATGAAGGTAAVMSGDRAAVNIPSGFFVNAKLSSPATITVERREQ